MPTEYRVKTPGAASSCADRAVKVVCLHICALKQKYCRVEKLASHQAHNLETIGSSPIPAPMHGKARVTYLALIVNEGPRRAPKIPLRTGHHGCGFIDSGARRRAVRDVIGDALEVDEILR